MHTHTGSTLRNHMTLTLTLGSMCAEVLPYSICVDSSCRCPFTVWTFTHRERHTKSQMPMLTQPMHHLPLASVISRLCNIREEMWLTFVLTAILASSSSTDRLQISVMLRRRRAMWCNTASVRLCSKLSYKQALPLTHTCTGAVIWLK